MKILNKVVEIFKNNPFDKIVLPEHYNNVYKYLRDFPDEKKRFRSEYNDHHLNNEFREHITKGFYGFAIGEPIIPEWNKIIKDIVTLCIESDPNFEINQIKLKFGEIRFYCYSNVIDDLDDVEYLISSLLSDKSLIY